MAQKYSFGSGSAVNDRIKGVGSGAIQLSDGTLVMLAFSSATQVDLVYSSDHSTINTIATNVAAAYGNVGNHYQNMTVVRDSLDNLYIVGEDNTDGRRIRAQAFTKGAGYTWTAQTQLFGVYGSNLGNPVGFAAAWCNTTGGTNSKGHVMVIAADLTGALGYATLDAGALLAGTGTLVINTGLNPAFLGTTTANTTGSNIDLDPDGFGATSGVAVAMFSTTTLSVGAWGINSAGALATNLNITTTLACGTLGTATKVRAIRYASNAWALIYPSTTAGRYMTARYSATAQLTAGTDSGAPASMPLNGAALSWDAFLDPLTANKVWVIATGAPSASNQIVYRLGCAVASGVTWDAATTTDDTLNPVTANGNDIRAVKKPIVTRVDWQVFAQSAATPTYVLYGDNTLFSIAPNAPTLTAPANASVQDLGAGFTFTWTFSDPDVGDTQSGYYLRRKISGAGSYEYWNAGTGAWQGTEVFNAGSAGSVTFAAAKWTNGNIYNWSVKTRDNGGLDGPYASDFTVTGNTAPTTTATAPSGSTPTSTPTVTWTFSDPEADAQQTYQVKVESGAFGATPGSGTAVWDSTEVTNPSARSIQVGVSLVNGTSYRFFVRTKANGQYSSWSFVTATVSLDPPAQPTFTAVSDNTNGRVTLAVQGRDNVLTTNQASLETDTTGWAAGANTAIARSTAQSLNGAASLSLTSAAAGTVSATTPTGVSGFAVTASKQYTALASFRSAVSARSATVAIFWYKAGGTASSVRASDTSGTVTTTTSGWTQALITATAPSDAVTAAIVVTVLSAAGASEVHYVDQIDIGPGGSSVWTRGGLAGIATALIEYSDNAGVSWSTVRGASAVALDSAANQQATVYDYESPPNTSRSYRATIQANV